MNPSDVPLFSPSKTQSQSGSWTQPASPDPFESYLAECEENAETVVPQPLKCLHGTQIPPFLSKTFDLVEDLSWDTIISWGSEGVSFVVWDPLELSRLLLPQNFKHNNFSSFIRQLNTYVEYDSWAHIVRAEMILHARKGFPLRTSTELECVHLLQGFRKIDTDRWEFANEHFIRGKRHLLKSIQRRRSPQTQHTGTFFAGSSVELGKEELETELEKLKQGKSLIMRDVAELQKQQRGYERHMEAVNEKLLVTEQRQKKMVSFFAKLFQNREFLARLCQKKKQRALTSERKVKKFIKHQNEPYKLDSLDFESITKNPVLDPSPIQEISEFLLESNIENTGFVQDVVTCHIESTIDKGENVARPKTKDNHKYFISFPEGMGKERNFVELPSLGSGNVVKQEDLWNIDFGDRDTMPSSSTDLLGNSSYYDDVSKLGFDGSFSDLWDSGLWPTGDSPLNELGGIENKMI